MKKKMVRFPAIAMSSIFVLTSVVAGAPLTGHAQEDNAGVQVVDNTGTLPYLDTSLSFEERAADLVSRMTLEEKQSQLKARTAAAIPRLGVRAYDWWSEALHGVARSGEATSFPTGLGIASTWDRELVQEMMDITSDEARAYTNEKGKGLSYWSPTINMARDPRWGRAEETYGEDPYLSAQIGNSFVRGLQGDDDTYLKSIATIKHFALNNSEFNRHNGDSQIDERTLREYYTKAFKDVIEEANVESLMTSYNRVNGVPMSANTYMLDTLTRRTWGFDGYITSDCGAIRDIYSSHKWVPEGWDHAVSPTETTALAIQAGTDLNCGDVYASQAVNAVNEGLLSEDDIDVALVRLFTARMKTGEFDPQENVPYASDEYSWANQISAEDHTQKAEQSSDEAVVMLKNEPAEGQTENILPLDASQMKNVVIVGDLADEVILGDYSGSPKEENKSTPVKGLTNLLAEKNPSAKVTYIQGGNSTPINGNYNFNIKNFKLINANGDVIREVLPEENTALDNCQVESGGNLGYTKPGGYVYYEGLDMSDVKSISADVAAPGSEARGGSIEVRLNSPDGTLLGTIETEHTDGWQSYKTFTTEYSQGGFTGKQNIYFVFKDPVVEIELSEEDKAAIEEADAVIAYVGTRESDSAEERDRTTMDLPRNQAELVNTLAGLNKNTVAYIQSVSEVNVESFKDNVPAILWCTYNGQAQGNAMARLLFGEANPSGKLPFTWYTSEHDLPDIADYNIRSTDESNGRTYQYYQGERSYPFGHGLSYSSFEYSDLKLSADTVTPNDTLTLSVNVTNTSDVAGAEVVEVYTSAPGADGKTRPVKELKGFEKVDLAAGETKTVEIQLPMSEQYYWDEDTMSEIYDQGTWKVQVGSSSEDIRQEGTFNLQGERNLELQTVTAIPDKTSLSVDEPENKAITKLSAAMNDQTFVDLSQAQVEYSSSNEKVATVDEQGIVTPVAGGTALITAKVTVNGVTKEDSYPVAVEQDVYLNDIIVDGQSLTGFQPEQEKYQYVVNGTDVPVVEAVVPQGMKAEITQAAAVPGTAQITVQAGEISRVYTVEFLETGVAIPEDVDFTQIADIDELKAAGWDIIRPNESGISLDRERGMIITSENGDLYQGTNTTKNLVVREAKGNWTASVNVHVDPMPAQQYQQAGMLIYVDDDNYIKLCTIYQSNAQQVQFGIENGAQWSDKTVTPVAGNDFIFRITKNGSTYQGAYSTDGGASFTDVGEVQAEYETPKVTVFAMNGNTSVGSINAEFKSVDFEALPAECTCGLYDLALTGYDTIRYEDAVAGDGVELKASAMKRGGCLVDGHLESEIEYQFSIPEGSENTAGASIEGNVLKAANPGKVTVEVKAIWNGVEITAQKELTVSEEDLTPYRTDLQNTILYGETQIVSRKDKYTEESFAAYMEKLSAAKGVLNNEEADKAALVQAKEDLLQAEEGLKFKEDGGNPGDGGDTGNPGDGGDTGDPGDSGNPGTPGEGDNGNAGNTGSGNNAGNGQNTNKSNGSKAARTGDDFPVLPVAGILLAGGVIVTMSKRRERKQDED